MPYTQFLSRHPLTVLTDRNNILISALLFRWLSTSRRLISIAQFLLSRFSPSSWSHCSGYYVCLGRHFTWRIALTQITMIVFWIPHFSEKQLSSSIFCINSWVVTLAVHRIIYYSIYGVINDDDEWWQIDNDDDNDSSRPTSQSIVLHRGYTVHQYRMLTSWINKILTTRFCI